MTQPVSYTLTFSQDERDCLIFVLGQAFPQMRGRMFLTPEQFMEMSTRVMHAKPDAQAARQMSGTAAAQAIAGRSAAPTGSAAPSIPQSEAPRIRWAHDKDGNEVPTPTGYESLTVEIWKIEDAPPRGTQTPRKKVTWPAGDGRGYVDAFCWDPALFPYLANRIKQAGTVIYIVRSKDKKYTNVIGIRA